MSLKTPSIDQLVKLFKAAHPNKELSGTAYKFPEQGSLCASFSVVHDVFVTNRDDLINIKKHYQAVPISGLILHHIEAIQAITPSGSTINRIQICYKILNVSY